MLSAVCPTASTASTRFLVPSRLASRRCSRSSYQPATTAHLQRPYDPGCCSTSSISGQQNVVGIGRTASPPGAPPSPSASSRGASSLLHAYTRTATRSSETHGMSETSSSGRVRHQHTHQQRWFDNNLEDYVEGSGPVETNTPEVQAIMREVVEQVLRVRHASDPTVYVGSSGIAYMLWHVNTLAGPMGIRVTSSWLERGLRYTRAAVSDMKRYPKEQLGVSLICGHAGVLCVAALFANTASRRSRALGRVKEAQMLADEAAGYVREYNGLVSIAVSPMYDMDEVLYGRAGFLYGALLLNQQLGSETIPHNSVQYIIAAMLRSGRKQAANLAHSSCPLYYTWPPGRNAEPYVGMAHGLMGIAHVLLLVRGMLQRSVRTELDELLECILAQEEDEDGNPGLGGHYPAVLPDPSTEGARPPAPLVHWCHGATGAAMLFARAYQETGRQQYLEAALRAGDAVWRRGLLRKGPGICHGVAGSAYAHLALYRATADHKHLHRALQVARFTRTEEFAAGARTPDHPYSLFEGLAGAACMWADLLNPLRSAFPLVELRDRPGLKGGLHGAAESEQASAEAAAAEAAAAAAAAALAAGGGPGAGDIAWVHKAD